MVRARSRLRSLLLALVAVATVGVTSCAPPMSPPPKGAAPGELLRSSLSFDEDPSVPEGGVADLAAGQLELAADLLAGIEGNASLSPLSINVAFSMLSAGARGQTLSELEDGLHLLPQEKLHLVHNALELALRDRDVAPTEEHDGVTLAQANQLFSALDFSAEDAFLDLLAERYDAGVRLLDFKADPEEAREAINAWVAEITRQKIDELLPQGSVNEATRLALVNALYLKAAWETPFEEDNTVPAAFTLQSGNEVQVPTMNGAVLGRHAIIDGVELVELPFVGEQLSFVIAVPRSATEEEALAALRTDALVSSIIELSLPKFSVRSQLDLRDALMALGVVAPFDSQVCDLSGITAAAGLFVGAAVHEAVVDVDEKGVEAAAATAILTVGTSAPGPEEVVVQVDEPFVFAILDRDGNVPLFVGRVVDPR